jgi:hypothetical protein
MRDIFGPKEERPWRGLYRLIADVERQLPFEDPESLVLMVVYMKRCLLPFGFEHLDERVEPACFFTRGLDGG